MGRRLFEVAFRARRLPGVRDPGLSVLVDIDRRAIQRLWFGLAAFRSSGDFVLNFFQVSRSFVCRGDCLQPDFLAVTFLVMNFTNEFFDSVILQLVIHFFRTVGDGAVRLQSGSGTATMEAVRITARLQPAAVFVLVVQPRLCRSHLRIDCHFARWSFGNGGRVDAFIAEPLSLIEVR